MAKFTQRTAYFFHSVGAQTRSRLGSQEEIVGLRVAKPGCLERDHDLTVEAVLSEEASFSRREYADYCVLGAINEKCSAKAISRRKKRLSDPRAEKRHALPPLRLFSRKDPALLHFSRRYGIEIGRSARHEKVIGL